MLKVGEVPKMLFDQSYDFIPLDVVVGRANEGEDVFNGILPEHTDSGKTQAHFVKHWIDG